MGQLLNFKVPVACCHTSEGLKPFPGPPLGAAVVSGLQFCFKSHLLFFSFSIDLFTGTRCLAQLAVLMFECKFKFLFPGATRYHALLTGLTRPGLCYWHVSKNNRSSTVTGNNKSIIP